MTFVMIIIFLLILSAMIGLGVYIKNINESEETEEDKIKKFKIFITIFFIGYLLLTIYSAISVIKIYNNLLVIYVFTWITFSIYYINIYRNLVKILDNIKSDRIFVSENKEYMQTIAKDFVYLYFWNIIYWLVSTLYISLTHSEIKVMITTDLLTNLLIAIIVQIISMIFTRAIKLYEENKLTI